MLSCVCALAGLFQYLQNWAVGFTDWNLLLDVEGGPYHDRGFGCNAPIQTNGTGGFFIQAPYYFMAHFSKYIPPNSTVVGEYGPKELCRMMTCKHD